MITGSVLNQDDTEKRFINTTPIKPITPNDWTRVNALADQISRNNRAAAGLLYLKNEVEKMGGLETAHHRFGYLYNGKTEDSLGEAINAIRRSKDFGNAISKFGGDAFTNSRDPVGTSMDVLKSIVKGSKSPLGTSVGAGLDLASTARKGYQDTEFYYNKSNQILKIKI